MNNLYYIHTKKKIKPFEATIELIAKKIQEDCAKLKMLNLKPFALIVGVDEISVINNFFNNHIKKNNGLNKINDLIIIGIPEKNYCLVVPNGIGALKLYAKDCKNGKIDNYND